MLQNASGSKPRAVEHAGVSSAIRARHQLLDARTDAKTDRDSQVSKAPRQLGQCVTRVQVSLLPEVQRLVETPPKVRFQCGNRFTIEPFKSLGTPAKLRQISRVASMSHYEAAV